MKLSESTGELLARITITMVIIKDSYGNYENKVDAPAHHDINGGYAVDTATRWRNDAMNNALQFLKMQLFRAALTGVLRKVVAQRNPNTMTLDEMYQIATDTQNHQEDDRRCTPWRKGQQRQRGGDCRFPETRKGAEKRKNSNMTNRSNRSAPSSYKSGSGNNANRNGKYCFYCKLQNHTQEDCLKRIHEKKPCRDKQGRAYWPKVYVTSNTDQQERDQHGQQQGFR